MPNINNETLYTIKRFFYNSNKDIETNNYHKAVCVGFTPCTLSECKVLLTKITNYKLAINKIVKC